MNHLVEVSPSNRDSQATTGIRGESDVERKLERARSSTLFDLLTDRKFVSLSATEAEYGTRKLNQQLKTGRIREPLGVLIDGRHLDNDVEMALYAACNDAPLSIVFSDLNGMKAINDTFSHATGDIVLRAYFDAIAAVVQNQGEAYRRGGDEVVTLLPAKNAVEAAILFDTVCKLTSDELIRHGEQTLPRLSLSVGIVTVTGLGADSAAGIVERADREMYRAKDSTRTEPRPSAIAIEGETSVRVIDSERR